jgi:hypothetical protein
MALNFNTDPYYDDYNEDKHFHRILFKPGVAVQARELTQLQSILQNQVTKFGKSIYKDGSMVIPGDILYDKNFNYVKLVSTYNSVDIDVTDYLNRELIGATSGIRAKVVLTDVATDTDPPTLYVKYLDSGTSRTANAFTAAEVIQTNDSNTTYYATVVSTGKCTGASISDGVYFIKDNFVKVNANSIILDKYLSNASYKVGLEVTESIITNDDDESLLDPAIGTYNYFAPGADRYKIELTLGKRSLTDTTSPDSFIELLRVVEGDVISLTDKPGYSILADELARRTYDESGDYTVSPFNLKFIEHLKTTTYPDGYLNSTDGGNVALSIAVLSPGKSYVKGYEVSTISNRYLTFNKPRDTANVENSIVRTPIGNYVEVINPYSMPDFTSDFITIGLYNQYTATGGTASGTWVGNARVRGFESTASNLMVSTSVFNTFLFDVQMKSGYTFERDVKQLYHPSVSDTGYISTAFTANIAPSSAFVLTGTSILANANVTVTGVNTAFTTELKVGDWIRFSSDTSNAYRVATVTSNTSITIDRGYPLANVSGVNTTRDAAQIIDNNLSSYIFPFPNDVIREISDSTIRTRRVFYGTLSANTITLSTAVGSTFASRTDTDYFAQVVSTGGGNQGKLYRINSGNFSFTDGTYRNIQIDLGSYGLTNQDILIYTTVIKLNPATKTKTATASSATYTAKTDCQAASISLGVADVYSIANVRMSSNVFGTAYSDSNAIDISDSYTLTTGQTPTYYGVSSISLKPGFTAPSGPIKIEFNYYAHGAGDFFSVESYPTYTDIPTFVDNGTTYTLRDSLDFRPRIANDGLNFKNTGAVRNEFLNYSNDFETNYSYYLPRIDKIYVTGDGTITYKEGVSSLTPVEPQAPGDAMPLYVIQHPAYGFNINKDSTFTPVDQKRYTMKDIGKLENRIKNLEYYTSLTLLELDTALFSVKDSFGLSRFKNGFIVDSFKGHGIGDTVNPDHNISMNFDTGELLPAFKQSNFKLGEKTLSDSERLSNGYVVKNNMAMLNYSDEEYIVNNYVSSDISINPYDSYTFAGSMKLTPPGDTWFDQTTLPLIYKDDNGTYDTLIPDNVGVATYGSIWNSWKQFWYSPTNTDKVKAIDTGAVITDASVTGSSTSVVFPYVRSATIKFDAKRLKPNTKMYVFFNEYDVTNLCYSANTTANVTGFDSSVKNQSNVITDEKGAVTGVFNFDVNTSGLKIPSGKIKLRLTDSPTNSAYKESFADAIYVANGTLNKTEPIRTKYNTPTVSTTYSIGGGSSSDIGNGGQSGSSSGSTTTLTKGFIDYVVAFLKGGDINNVSAADLAKYNTFYIDACYQSGTTVAAYEAGLTQLNSGSFGIYSLRDNPSSNAENFNFKGGGSISSVPDRLTTLPDGIIGSNYGTATNILSAVNGNGQTYVSQLQSSLNGTGLWDSVVLPTYAGTVSAVSTQIGLTITQNSDGSISQSLSNPSMVTADMQSFYNVGVANGSFAAGDIASAIQNYAAAQTLSVIEANDHTATNAYADNALAAAGANGLLA